MDSQFKNDLNIVSEMVYAIAEKIDSYPEYHDRFILIEKTLSEIISGNGNKEYNRLQSLRENVKALKLDIETKEYLI